MATSSHLDIVSICTVADPHTDYYLFLNVRIHEKPGYERAHILILFTNGSIRIPYVVC